MNPNNYITYANEDEGLSPEVEKALNQEDVILRKDGAN